MADVHTEEVGRVVKRQSAYDQQDENLADKVLKAAEQKIKYKKK